MNLFYRQRWRASQRKLKRRIGQREFRPDAIASLQPDIHPVLQLQQTVGNRSVARLVQSKRLTEQGNLRSIPFPPALGQAGDHYRKEAARVLHRQLGASLQLRQLGASRQTNRQVAAPIHQGLSSRGAGADGGPAVRDQQSPSTPGGLTTTGQKPSPTLAVGPTPSATGVKALTQQPRKPRKLLAAAGKHVPKGTADEATGAQETIRPPVRGKKAPAAPEEDPGYQSVVKQWRIMSEREKKPLATPEKKRLETQLAANLTPEEISKQNAYGDHLDKLHEAEPRELTVDEFMSEFKATTLKLAEALPNNKDQHGTVGTAASIVAANAVGKLQIAEQSKSRADPLRAESAKSASDYQVRQEAETHELKPDPAGSTPSMADAKAAAPKAKTDDEISLDDKSRSLDDALRNHTIKGQVINIEEASLAYPVSGESTFDEAGAAKRKAQDEIKKSKPRYREDEKEVISQSQNDMQSLVHRGLEGQHGLRSANFNEVLGAQKTHKTNIETKKRAVLNQIEGIYSNTTSKVKEELKKIEGIEETFEKIVTDAEKYFNDNAKQELEYIYTPGIFDYSDWKDNQEAEIKAELENQKRLNPEPSYGFHLGVDPLYFKALRIVQDRYAEKWFANMKSFFIGDLNRQVAEKIAKPVVAALNAAKKHIQEGKEQVQKAFASLDPKEQEECQNVLDAVTGKFEQLEESVDDRRREIINDMARSYNQSVGKLKSSFDAIKKDVLTSWFEKAWNKLKAVVNAIIEFATRIAELLGRLAYLVGDIVSSPRRFFNNLVTGIGQGFSTFVDRIGEFLATAFFDWLRGSGGVAIQMPKDLSPKGIFGLFAQLLNLTTETIWERMEVVYDKTIANAFRRGEILVGRGLEIFRIVKEEGFGGLWDEIKDSLGNILEETLDMIKESVLYAAIKKVIFEIGKMLVPGGGFIAIAEKVIRLLQFIAEARNKILDLIESFVDSVEMAVKGNVPGIVKHITGALTKFITVALDFLVSLFGLGSLKEKVTRFIERMRKPVVRGIDWVLNKLKPLVMKGAKWVKGKAAEAKEWGKEKLYGGTEEDKRQRLAKGMAAGVAAIDSIEGDKVPGRLAKAKLIGLRVRYRLPVLEPVAKNGRWYVHGEIQRAEEPTHKAVAGEINVPPSASEPAVTGEPSIILQNEAGAIYFHSDQTRLVTVFNGEPYYVSTGTSVSRVRGQPPTKIAGDFYHFRGILERPFEYTERGGRRRTLHRGWLIKGVGISELAPNPALKNYTYRVEGDFHQPEQVNAWLVNHGAVPLDFHAWYDQNRPRGR
jgi:phage-related protein